mmetsp:Transcript_4973/g.8104  ORF Transcript_4973/g.8104 Transcript_4973/m.8104 type:complete len:330 (+) Transcript_4973:86-1075(+)
MWSSFVLAFLITVRAVPHPLERYFFNNQSFIVCYTVENSQFAQASFTSMFQAVESTPTLLEMRIIQPFNNPSVSSGSLNTSQLVAWFMWQSVTAWLNRSTIFLEDDSLAFISKEYFAVNSYFNGCHYCNKSFAEPVITAHFSNEQSLGAYPLEATFAVFLAAQTQAEIGTLSYLATNLIAAEPTAENINFTFNRVDFWEMYNSTEAFNTHVYDVNVTLDPAAPNWFVDLGNTNTIWYQVLNVSSGCYNCLETTSDASSDTGTGSSSSNGDMSLSLGAFYFLVVGLPILNIVLLTTLVYVLYCRRAVSEATSTNKASAAQSTSNPVIEMS